MKIGIEQLRKALGKTLLSAKCEILIEHRGKIVGRFTPEFMVNSTVQEPRQERTVQSDTTNSTVDRLSKARSALKQAEQYSSPKNEPSNSTVDPEVEEVRIWIEDGIEHKVTKDMMQRRFGKAWPTFWKQSQPTITH